MKRLLCGIALLTSSACAAPPPSSDWDAQATAALNQEIDTLLRDVDSGDMNTMIARFDPDITFYDLDENNKPVAYQGADQAKQYFTRMGDAMKSQGLKFTSTKNSSTCHATATMGFCALQFDQTIAAGGQTQGPFKFRGTLIARKAGDAWRWVHWHGSFAEFPKTT